MTPRYALGLDYGTNSVRGLLVETGTGREVATAVHDYPHGQHGVVLDERDPLLARQHPADYLSGAEAVIKEVLAAGAKSAGIAPGQIAGIGVDTTGSTPLPLDASGQPLAFSMEDRPAALAWLWKDHTAHAEAEEITALAQKLRPQYLKTCGGRYSSEWFWAKILHCVRTERPVAQRAATWVEIADWIPAALCGTSGQDLRRGICAAGHKALYHSSWGGFPDAGFLAQLDPALAQLRATLPERVYSAADAAGKLSPAWAARVGLRAGTPVAVGAFDAHLGAVGAGVAPHTLVKIIGTSSCDLMIAPEAQPLGDIPGLCGIVPGSIVPGFHGLEAGQSAVGDLFNWLVETIAPAGASHESLTAEAGRLRPGESGLLSLDWHNGNRTVLTDQRLSGLILGLTLQTRPAEIYRALIEATAFGARVIMERFEEYGVEVRKVVNAGGIAAKNPLVMQIYADVLGRPVAITRGTQTCALGAAIAGAVAAGTHATFAEAMAAMSGEPQRVFQPEPAARAVYEKLFRNYRRLHDAFGLPQNQQALGTVMKELLALREEVRGRA